jgi:hypothetical protein
MVAQTTLKSPKNEKKSRNKIRCVLVTVIMLLASLVGHVVVR